MITLTSISLISLFYLWKRPDPRSKTLAFLLIGGIIWSIGLVFEIWSDIIWLKIFWHKFQFIGVSIVPTLWLVYTLQYLGYEQFLTRRYIMLLSIIPIITIFLIFTNEAHGWIWSPTMFNFDNSSLAISFGRFESVGLWLWIFIMYTYLILLLSLLFSIYSFSKSKKLYQLRALFLLFSVIMPFFGSIFLMIVLRLVPTYVTPSIVLIIANFLTWINPSKLQIVDIMPVAHDAIIESMTDSIIVLDDSNRIVNLNPSAESLFGKSTEDVIGKKIDYAWNQWSKISNTKLDKVTLDINGNSHTYEIISSPIVDGTGRIGLRTIVLRDITERIEIENAIIEAEEEKSRLKIRDKFISAATHELRTPLVSMKGYMDRILEGRDGQIPKLAKIELEIVKRNTERLLSLTDDLLDIRRIESGKIIVNLEPLDFQEIIEQCIKEIQPFIKEKNQKLRTKVQKGLLPIIGDRIRLSQALMNILNNASKFTPDYGEILLKVEKKSYYFKIEVIDTGIGIKKNDLKKIFEPFADIKRETYIKGTGLGLSVTKGIIEGHGGKIWAASQGEDKGSVFIFTLPRME